MIIKGLRSYREQVEVDFTDVSLFAITGPTGAGKSSILEALYFALYSAATFHSRQTSLLISDGEPTMTVSLEFSSKGQIWEVTRSIHRNHRPPVHELRGPDGVRHDGAKEVNAKLEELIGLRPDDFLKTVVLPQGRFQALLHSKPGDRAPLLKSLLGLDQIDRLAEQARQLQTRLDTALTYARSRSDDRKQFTPEQLEALSQQRRELQERLQELQKLTRSLDQHQQRWQFNQEQFQRQTRTLEKLGGTPVSRGRELLTLQEVARDLEADLERNRSRLEGLRSTLEEQETLRRQLVAEGLMGPGLHQLVETLTRYEGLEARQTDLEAHRRQLEGRSQKLDQARTQAQAEVVELETRLKELTQSGAELARAHEQAEKILIQARDQQNHLQHLAQQRDEQHQALENLKTQRQEHQQRLPELEQELESVAAELDQARLHLQVEERRNQAAALCQDLHQEVPCPVCQRELPPDWKPPAAGSLDEAGEQLRRVEDKLLRVQKAKTSVEAELGALDRRLEEAEHQTQALDRRREELQQQLQNLVGDSLENHQLETQSLKERLLAERESYSDCHHQLKALRSHLEAQTRESQELVQEGAKLAAAEKELKETGQQAHQQLCAALSDAPGRWRTLLTEKQEQAAALERKLEELRKQLQEEQAGERRLQQSQQKQIDEPLRELSSAAHRLHALLELETELSTTPDLGELITIWEDLEKAAVTRRAELEASLEANRKRREQADEELQEHLAPFGFSSQEEAQLGRDEAARELARAESLQEQAQKGMRELGELQKLLRPGEQLQRTYEFLRGTFSNRRGSFATWLLERRQQELLEFASKALGEMTSGHYGFASDFQIIDRFSGQVRPATTLSGGESFLASLSLAMGLSELVGRRGGQLEAFFLDEGFGSLSLECLDKALGALERLAQNGRIIGVISHVEAVAQRLETVWRVDKGPSGSSLRVLEHQDDADIPALLGPADTDFDPEQHPLLIG